MCLVGALALSVGVVIVPEWRVDVFLRKVYVHRDALFGVGTDH